MSHEWDRKNTNTTKATFKAQSSTEKLQVI